MLVGKGGNSGTPRSGRTDTREVSTLYPSQVMARSKNFVVNRGVRHASNKNSSSRGSTRLSRQNSGPNFYEVPVLKGDRVQLL